MRRVGFVLVCLACAGHARRAQTSLARSSSAAPATSQTLLSRPRPEDRAAAQSLTLNPTAAFNPSLPGAYAPAGARAFSRSAPLALQHRQRASHIMQDDLMTTEEVAKMEDMKNDTSDEMTMEEKMAQELAKMEQMRAAGQIARQPKYLKWYDEGEVNQNDLRLSAAAAADPEPDMDDLKADRREAYGRNQKFYQPTKQERREEGENIPLPFVYGKEDESPGIGRYFRLDGPQRVCAVVLTWLLAVGFGKTSPQVLDTTIIQYTQLAAEALGVAYLAIAVYGIFSLISRATDDSDENIVLWFLKLLLTGPGGLQEVRRSLEESGASAA